MNFTKKQGERRFERITIFTLIIFILSTMDLSCSLSNEKSSAQIAPINQSNSKQVNSVEKIEQANTIVESSNSKDKLSQGDITSNNVRNEIIVPGKSVGLLTLGDTRETAISYLGEPSDYEDYARWDCNELSMILWSGNDLSKVSVAVFLKDGKIEQIESISERFKTENRIKSGDIPKKLIKLYPNIEAYELLYSSNETDSKKNVVYWVDNKQGIAFVLNYYDKYKSRRVGSIIIYNPRDKFQPGGCVSLPQEFVSRPKWYLD